jgi:hypothetical protein
MTRCTPPSGERDQIPHRNTPRSHAVGTWLGCSRIISPWGAQNLQFGTGIPVKCFVRQLGHQLQNGSQLLLTVLRNTVIMLVLRNKEAS